MTLALLNDLRKAPDLQTAASQLGTVLGLGKAAPEEVTKRVLDDPSFGQMLIGLRNLPEMRDRVLAKAMQDSAAEAHPRPIKVVKQAAKSVLRWGMEGMKPAEPWVITQRIATCNACEYQVPAPETLIYRGAKVVAGKDAKICSVCNCLTNTKAAISTERCPVKSDENPEESKWGEPWVDVADHPKGPW